MHIERRLFSVRVALGGGGIHVVGGWKIDPHPGQHLAKG